MNMQAMIKQAQKLQQDMIGEKKKLDEEDFVVENEVLTLKMKGSKRLVELNFKSIEDKEMIEDLTIIAFNQALEDIEKETEKRMGQYTRTMPGLF